MQSPTPSSLPIAEELEVPPVVKALCEAAREGSLDKRWTRDSRAPVESCVWMAEPEKTKDEPSLIGKELTIWVYVEGVPNPTDVQLSDMGYVSTLCRAIIGAFPQTLKGHEPTELKLWTPEAKFEESELAAPLVWTPSTHDATELTNARARLAAVLRRDQPGPDGGLSVYVVVPPSKMETKQAILDPTTLEYMFWDSLQAAALMRGKPFNQLIVRECHSALFDMIWSAVQRVSVVYVTGTPGVGKTTFRNYVAWRILRLFQGQPVAIAMAKGGVHSIDVMCSDGTQFYVENWRDVGAMKREKFKQKMILGKNFFILADVTQGNVDVIQEIPKGLIVFTSPTAKTWKDQGKQDATILLMPLWKEAELLARRSSMGVDFHERFIKYGGVVRVVWGSKETEERVEADLQVPMTDETLKALNESDYQKIEHRFVYLNVREDEKGYNFKPNPNPDALINPTLAIGTRHIARLMARSIVRNRLDRTNYQFFAGAPPSVAGLLFESVALELLLNYSEAMAFPIRKLDDNATPPALSKLLPNGKFRPSKPTLVEFNNESDVVSVVKKALETHAVVLGVPRSTNFAGFDGIYAWNEGPNRKAFLLQVILNPNHPFLGNRGCTDVLAAFAKSGASKEDEDGASKAKDGEAKGFEVFIGYFVDAKIFATFEQHPDPPDMRSKDLKTLFYATPQFCLKAEAKASLSDSDDRASGDSGRNKKPRT